MSSDIKQVMLYLIDQAEAWRKDSAKWQKRASDAEYALAKMPIQWQGLYSGAWHDHYTKEECIRVTKAVRGDGYSCEYVRAVRIDKKAWPKGTGDE